MAPLGSGLDMHNVESAQAILDPALPPETAMRVGSMHTFCALGTVDFESAWESPPLKRK